MNGKAIISIVSVWSANAIGWIFALSTDKWLDGIIMVKEILGGLSILLAMAYTFYKLAQTWTGWKPWKKKKS